MVAWRQTADFCNKYLTKGRKVAVEGSIQVRSYDAQDGTKRWVTEIIAESVEALGKRDSGDPGPTPPENAKPATPPPQNGEQQRMNMYPDPNQFTEVDDDDLPFD